MIYDLLIIGAGPAGITAGIYAKRANLKVAIIENNAPGGQMVNTGEIENYPGFLKISGPDLAMEMFNHGVNLDVEFIFDDVVKVKNGTIKEIITNGQTLKTKAIIIATGATPRKLGLKHEEQLSSRGISWCAICDGPFYRGKDVVVVGGGNSAVEEANYLATITNSITIVQNLNQFTADKKAIDLLMSKDNVKVYFNSLLKEFIINDKGNLEAVKIEDPSGNETIIKTDGVFEYIGLKPATESFKDLNITDQHGYIETNENMETTVKGIYAAGDVRNKDIRQISTAINDGAIAAQRVLKYLEG